MDEEEKSFRRGVIGIVQRGKRILLIRKNGRDKWNFPGGGLEEDEDSQEAFFREMKEEVGLEEDDFTSVETAETTHRFEWGERFKEKKGFDGQIQDIVVGSIVEDAEPVVKDNPERDESIDDLRFVHIKDITDTLPFQDLRESFRKVKEEGIIE